MSPGHRPPVVSPLAGLGVAVVAISTSAVLVRWSDAPSLVKAFYRVGFTAALIAPVALVGHRDEFGVLCPRTTGLSLLAGVALALHFGAWFESLEHTTVAASVTLVQLQPAFVAVGAWALLDERVDRRTVAGIAVALVGVVVMSAGELLLGSETGAADGGTLYGDALALLGAVAAAAYVLAGRSVRRRLPLAPYVLVVYAACAVVLATVVAARGLPLLDYPGREWLLFLAMAVGPGLFGHTVINWALAHLDSSVVSVSLLGEPVGSTLLALVLLSEVPPPLTLVGGTVVLVGIYVTVGARER